MNTLDEWLRLVARELELEPSLDRDLILDLSRVVAHEVARPAAPLTAFLVGLAAGRAGGSPADARVMAERVTALVPEFSQPSS